MSIKAGDRMPSGTFKTSTADGRRDVTADELFKGKKVVLFAVPGAFTPTCDAKHLPGFVQTAEQFRAKGVATVACFAVNDVFVMGAWGKHSNVGDKVLMLADGNGDYARALGLSMTASPRRCSWKRPANSRSPPPSMCWRRCSAACAFLPQQLLDLGHDFKQIAHQAVVRHFEDRRLGILVDRDDGAGILDAGQMLDRP